MEDSRSDRGPLGRGAFAGQISRAQFLKRAGLGVVALSGAPLAASCAGTGGSLSKGGSSGEANNISGSFNWKREKGKTIKLLLNKHPYQETLLKHLGAFKKLTGINVQYDVYPEDNYFDKVTVALSSGQASYDVFMTGAYQCWQYGPPGYMEDLMPWIKNKSATNSNYDWEDIIPALRQADQWDLKNGDPLGEGKQLAIPWGWESNVVAYNKRVMDKYGITRNKMPETFGDLIDLAETITKKEPGMYGIATRGSRSWATIHPGFMTMYSRFGQKDYKVEKGKGNGGGNLLIPQMDTPEAVDFQNQWAIMNRKGGAPNWTSYDWYKASSDLGAGKAAMLFDATSASYFQNQKGASKEAGNIRWYPGPKGPNGSLATNLWVWSLAMPSSSQNKMAAWLLIQWATGKDHLLWGALKGDQIDPVRHSVADNPKVKDKLNREDPTYLETFNEVLPQTKLYFTPESKFFQTTTNWAAALENVYRGQNAKSTFTSLAQSLKKQVSS